MEKEFNLLREPWIRVLDDHQKVEEVSLTEFFYHAHQYRQLAGEMATQNMALLRLLLAIAITVFYRFDPAGEEDPFTLDDEKEDVLDRWREYWRQGEFRIDVFQEYLMRYEDRFWLFHPTAPFWQTADLKYGTDYGIVSILGNIKESNNKATRHHFSMMEGDEISHIGFAEAARWLLHLNGYGVNIKTDKKAEGPGKPAGTGRLGKLGLFFLEGRNLFETIMLNLTPLREGGNLWNAPSPVWERPPERLQGIEISRPDNLPRLYTMQSRRAYLKKEGQWVTGFRALNGEFYPFDDDFTEPMTLQSLVKTDKKANITVVRPKMHDPGIQAWREFPAMFGAEEGKRIPGLIRWNERLYDEELIPRERLLTYHMIGLVYGDGMCYTYGDCIDDSLSLASDLLNSMNEAWITHITGQIEKCRKVADTTLSRFAAGMVQLLYGKDENKKRSEQRRLKEWYYGEIDHPFRYWLQEIRPDQKEMEETLQKWERQAYRIASNLIREYAVSMSNNIARFSEENGKEISLPGLLNTCYAGLRKIYLRETVGGDQIGKNER